MHDTLFDGRVSLWQPVRGYRANVDSLLLAHFAASERPRTRRLVDLGAGTGAVALAYAHLGVVEHADLVEREPALAEISQRNLADNGLQGSAHAVDLERDGLPRSLQGVADVVVSNPPYFAPGGSRGHGAGARARHGGVRPFLAAAAEALGRRGRAFVVYPVQALPELLHVARDVQLVPKTLVLVHPFAAARARIALVELRRAKPGGLVVLPPLVEWTTPGVRTEVLSRLVSGESASGSGHAE